MKSLRDRWRRNAVYQYFAVMEPIDRATALIVLAILFAWAFTFAAIVRSREPRVSPQPATTISPATVSSVPA